MSSSSTGLAPEPWSTSASIDRLAAADPTIGLDLNYQGGAPYPQKGSPYGQVGAPPPPPKPPSGQPEWHEGQSIMQGFIGVTFYDKVKREGGNTADVEGESGGLDQMPLIGGGGQWKLGGNGLDYGIEGFFSFEGRANAAAVAIGGGGAAVAVDVNLFIVDVYGGPFISKFLGDKLRVYAGAGPMFQFASYDQEFSNTYAYGSGFGVGGYVRTGLEMILPSRTMIGLGALWMDTNVDLSGNLGNLDMEGYQIYLTVSRGL
jgi:hypothetical protein